MDDVKNILKKLRKLYAVKTNKALAGKLDVSYNTLNTWIKRNVIPFEILNKIVQERQLSYDWLLIDNNTFTNNMIYGHGNTLGKNINTTTQCIKGEEKDLLENFNKLPKKKQKYYLLQIAADAIKTEIEKEEK